MKLITNDKIYIENVNGISVVDAKNIEEKDIILYLEDLVLKIGNIDVLDIIVFGNKEYIKEHSKLNNITFSNIDNIESDCDTFMFIKLENNEVYLNGIIKREIIKNRELKDT